MSFYVSTLSLSHCIARKTPLPFALCAYIHEPTTPAPFTLRPRIAVLPPLVRIRFWPFQRHIAHISRSAHASISLQVPLPRQQLAAVRSLPSHRLCTVRAPRRRFSQTQRSSRCPAVRWARRTKTSVTDLPVSLPVGESITSGSWVSDDLANDRPVCRASCVLVERIQAYGQSLGIALDARTCPFARPLTLLGHVGGAATAQQHS